MILYYLLLILERFRDYPHLRFSMFSLGPVPVTTVKMAGAAVVVAAVILPRPADAAPRVRNALPALFTLFAALPLLGAIALGIPLGDYTSSCLLSFALLLIATRRMVATSQRLVNAVRALVIAAAASAAWCYKESLLGGADRAWGIGGDPNYEALELILVVPLALWMLRRETRRRWRIAGGMAAVAIGGASLLTQSRGGLLALAVVLIIEVTRAAAGNRLPILFLMALLAGLAPHSLWRRFESIRVAGRASNPDEGSTLLRTELALAAINMIERHPITGVGADRFKMLCVEYNPALHSRAGDATALAHNTYLQIASEDGLPTLVLFVAMLFFATRNYRSVRQLGRDESICALAQAMTLAITAYAIAAFFLTAAFVVAYWLIVFLSQNLWEIALAGAPQAASDVIHPKVAGEQLWPAYPAPRIGIAARG